METKNIPKRVNFFDWYEDLPVRKRDKVRKLIIKETDIPVSTWYTWLERRRLSRPAKVIIKKLFPEYDFTFEDKKNSQV